MRRYFFELKNFFRKGDLVLLLLCLLTSAFGCIIISSATNAVGFTRYLTVQIVAILLGVIFYIMMSAVDVDFVSEHRTVLVVFNVFLLALLIPFGTGSNLGNRSWLDLPLIPVDIQPAEICKITYILITASVMNSHQNRISSVPSVIHIAIHLILLFGMNMVISSDLGVSLIFVFIFIGMTFAGGVSIIWYLLGGGALVVAAPVLWNQFMDDYQKERIQMLYDPKIDPEGLGVRWHTNQSLLSLNGGGFSGQGLFNGNRTQTDSLNAQHTDFIFSAIGEELGFVGCILVIVMLLAIIIRCIYVGVRSQNYMRRLICFGAAAALIFQVCINIGMCIGVAPVIGLTLPLISYGGSSTVSLYAMLGLVSGVHARPEAAVHERYIQPPR